LFQDSAIDRCIDDLSSTLELAEALERQLEQVYETVSRTGKATDAPAGGKPG